MDKKTEYEVEQACKNVDVKRYKQALGIEKPREMKKIYAVKDIDMGFLEIYPAVNDVIAIRNFGMTAKENKQLQAFADKYELYKVGDLDVATGEFVQDLRRLAVASDFAEINK